MKKEAIVTGAAFQGKKLLPPHFLFSLFMQAQTYMFERFADRGHTIT
jgi:hypothetical protein